MGDSGLLGTGDSRGDCGCRSFGSREKSPAQVGMGAEGRQQAGVPSDVALRAGAASRDGGLSWQGTREGSPPSAG